MNETTKIVVPQTLDADNAKERAVRVQINVSEDHLEQNILNSFNQVTSKGQELDITFIYCDKTNILIAGV